MISLEVDTLADKICEACISGYLDGRKVETLSDAEKADARETLLAYLEAADIIDGIPFGVVAGQVSRNIQLMT